MKSVLVILNIVALIGALIWLMTKPSWEPLVTSLGLIGTLIAQLFSDKNSEGKTKMTQKGGKNSRNYQSKGDININQNNER